MKNLDKKSMEISPPRQRLPSDHLPFVVKVGEKLSFVTRWSTLTASSLEKIVKFIKARFYPMCLYAIEIFYILYN